ncbi:hypothetical protein BpHYR1_049587 [Brachionus plicatilis]|uniref:Uncharacterized protein n=1 Tax=Brachionus plicatilis TaxID=10195 RepID=A0A3M7RZB8_BRAPC|nr:hypothetical protein BpHYR1_049587 [Brachionus plicatilis]
MFHLVLENCLNFYKNKLSNTGKHFFSSAKIIFSEAKNVHNSLNYLLLPNVILRGYFRGYSIIK